MKKEIRHISLPVELRKDESGGESRRITGYALVFNERSRDLGGFTEVIAPEALEGVLERSDVLALLDHNISRGVLARHREGGGSLELEADEKGLRYSFEAPHTALGEELLEGLRRGDISGSSFAFTVEKDEWEKEGDGRYLRTIRQFGELFDVSPVYHPAYEATSVDTRGLEALRGISSDESEEREGTNSSDESEEREGTKTEEDKDSKGEKEDKDSKDSKEDEEGEEDKREINIVNHTRREMKKEKFSLLRAIRHAVNHEEFDDAALAVFEEGSRALQSAGIKTDGSIQIPLEPGEKRFEESPNGIIASQAPAEAVAGMGGEVVPTELFDILGPLRDRMIVTQLGARMLTLAGNVDIPLYSGANAEWESEIGESKETAGKFSVVKMSPKRLSATLPISKQFIIQTSASAEALLRQNLIDCIADKLQSTMLGDEAATDTRPAGLLYGVEAETTAFKFSDAIDWEEQLETAKIFGEKKYALSPRAKAILRSTKIDAGSGLMVMQNNEVLGIPTLTSGAMKPKGLILGDWSSLYIATFGALDLVVDPYSRKKNAQVEITVNAWVDYVTVRPEAFVKKILK